MAIGVLLALPVLSMAYEKDEPNNDFDHATVLKEAAKGSIGFDDTKDFYKFFVGVVRKLKLTHCLTLIFSNGYINMHSTVGTRKLNCMDPIEDSY